MHQLIYSKLLEGLKLSLLTCSFTTSFMTLQEMLMEKKQQALGPAIIWWEST